MVAGLPIAALPRSRLTARAPAHTQPVWRGPLLMWRSRDQTEIVAARLLSLKRAMARLARSLDSTRYRNIDSCGIT